MKIDKWRLGCGIFDVGLGISFCTFAAINNSFPVTIFSYLVILLGSAMIATSFEEDKK